MCNKYEKNNLTCLVRKTIYKYLQQRNNTIFFSANNPQVNEKTGKLSITMVTLLNEL